MSCKPVARAEGVALMSKDRLDFACLPDDAEEVAGIIASQWRRFAGWINTGPFFEHLPPTLKRDETIAQIAKSTVIEMVTSLSGTPVFPVDLQLVT